MKKEYTKPSVCIERFELNQHIASCEFNVRGSQKIEECYAVGKAVGDEKLFMSGNNNCEADTEEFCTYNAVSTLTFSSY